MAVAPGWAWATNLTAPSNTPAPLVGQSFVPISTYKDDTELVWRDGDNNGSVNSTNSGTAHTNDGVAIDGVVYNVSDNWNFSVRINYADGTSNPPVGSTSPVIQITAMRLVDDPDFAGSGPLVGRVLFRPHDADINTYFEGSDGTGGEQYNMKQISSIDILGFVASVNGRSIANGLSDPYPVICFAKGSGIRVDDGVVPVENLAVGQMVLTRDSGLQPIRWIGSRKISAEELQNNPALRPVRIAAGALGENVPRADLLVSRHHRVLVQSVVLARVFDTDEILVPAKDLIDLPGIDLVEDLPDGIEYYHILCDNHEVIYAEGVLAESMLTGTEALKSLDETAREEIAILMPHLQDAGYVPTPARTLFSGRKVRNAIQRHVKNNKPLLQNTM